MKNILTELVNLLTENEVSISSPLLKLKVLASRLKNEPLFEWLNKELAGYDSSDELPKYRKYSCIIKGNFINGPMNFTNQNLAINNLPDKVRKNLETVEFYDSISTLESYLKNKEIDSLKIPIYPEYLGFITDNYQSMGNHLLSVYSAYKEIGKGAVEQTISEVRNSALNLILKVEEEFGLEINMDELIHKRNEVNQTIFNTMNNIINSHGDGNFINTGDNSTIKNNVRIEKSSFDSLRNHLKENFIESSDIDELESVINEQPDKTNHLFGPKVNSWIKKMMNKSLDGSWQVGIGTAGTLLAEALKHYYGM